jgi:hypothetical protein
LDRLRPRQIVVDQQEEPETRFIGRTRIGFLIEPLVKQLLLMTPLPLTMM